MRTGDRAVTAAQDADGPRAVAAAEDRNHILRDVGERDEAPIGLAACAGRRPR